MTHTVGEERRTSNHFEALFTYAPMGILMTDSRGGIMAINPFALNEFGYKQEELIDRQIDILIPARHHAKHNDHFHKYFERPETRTIGMGMDLFAVRKDGSEFPMEVSLGSYANNGEIFVIAFISNISLRVKSISDIKNMHDELEDTVEHRTAQLTNAMHELERNKEVLSIALGKERDLNELKSRFVSMASHEFRTPLSTVLSSSYLIQKYHKTEEQGKREKHLSRIVSSVEMLTGILNDFLSLGRIEEGKIPLRLTAFNIRDFISSILSEIQDNIKSNQKINYHHHGDLQVSMDAILFKQILMNLVSNASKFSADICCIEINSTLKNSILVLSVKDQGIGISNEDQKHLMERFFRGHNVANIHGTGLGLHILSKYAELMNGFVNCISELDKGTEFIITFNLNGYENEKNIID
ncbi:MAG TPA: PAS domain-containing sensor histidine kinase [Saprospiraceae bacterium]|nr:PAS domain-containing sensor histidine kinase [Saprospiraceae bacterium]